MHTPTPWQTAVFASLLLLGGCAIQPKPATEPPPTQTAATPEQLWQQRQAAFSRMGPWRMEGKAGLQWRDDSASFQMRWQQDGSDHYTITLQHPLGETLTLKGTPNDVTLQTRGQTYRDTSAEHLLQSQLGITLPLQGLQYWARALPAPNSKPAAVKLDAQGRPQTLQQAGWNIEYSGWHGTGWQALPQTIQLANPNAGIKAKLLAEAWVVNAINPIMR